MPLYEYECAACGHQFEVIRKFSDPPEEKCPKCGGPVHKLQSAPAFQFKGSGWYVTDYGKSAQSDNKAGSDSKSDNKKNGATETAGKSESASANSASTSSTPAASGTAGQKSGD
jgi:putative FmdB family regulatory protein